jgi:hypothetical protein
VLLDQRVPSSAMWAVEFITGVQNTGHKLCSRCCGESLKLRNYLCLNVRDDVAQY